ncbi:YceI family protein [Pseudochryseolinea flava]|uniref:YceI family protein n=1 Tax=Pseudochryseolinea flava TaxID=2059302 RepID=A0A364Y584_9BACT|nr:YceI family protein [Pseudochryseolinea flava]RAW01231.1 YceI family protein [Pseudochryseolinea flava]
MKFFLFMVFAVALNFTTSAQQRYFAEKSKVSFYSDGVVEDITAVNEKVTSIFDAFKGDVAFLMSIKDFQFEKKLMQVHFNEKYMESEKYPKSTFQGKIVGFNSAEEGVQQVRAVGKLSIHGVTKDVDAIGTIEKNGSFLQVKSKFNVKLLDYNINVPQIVWKNIAQQVEVTIEFTYRQL